MHLFEELAESRIKEAIHTGDLEHLSGMGKPVNVDVDPFIPESKRMAYKILKNAGYLPEELQIRQQIHEMEQTLATIGTKNRTKLMLKLQLLFIKLDNSGDRHVNLLVQNEYYEKMLLKLAEDTVQAD